MSPCPDPSASAPTGCSLARASDEWVLCAGMVACVRVGDQAPRSTKAEVDAVAPARDEKESDTDGYH